MNPNIKNYRVSNLMAELPRAPEIKRLNSNNYKYTS
jgi:hypothetical protein